MAQNDFFLGGRRAQPRLNPPVDCWREDMPENHAPQLAPPRLDGVSHQNDIWLELPRYEGMVWGGMLFLAVLMFGCTVFMAVTQLASYKQREWDGWDFFIFFTGDFVLLSFLMFCLRVYFSDPRDQPIRLNRKRQKIYTFEFQRKPWNPWGKWPVTVRAFDWADVYGEIGVYSNYDGAGLLYCAVCEPGTCNVIDRFGFYSGSFGQLHQAWSYLCQYMQHDPELPEAEIPDRPYFWYPRKADKWPADMEYESTTAPEADSPAIPKGNI